VNLNVEILETIGNLVSTYLAVIFVLVLVVGYLVVLVIFLGVVSEKGREERPSGHQIPHVQEDGYRRLYRSGRNRILGGVCGGLGEYANLDPNIIRVLWILLLIVSFGIAIIAYVLMWILVPRNPRDMWG
jgi:phage shock protein C